MIVNDYLGQEIHLGDFVVYPSRQGSSMWLCRGTVTRVSVTKRPEFMNSRLDWSNVKPTYKIQVNKLIVNWRNNTTVGKRKVTLSHPERIVVIHSVTDSKT